MLFPTKLSFSSWLAGSATTALAFKLGLLAAPTQAGGPVLAELARHLTVESLPDNAGGFAKTIRLTGVNLQIVNGLGATNGHAQDPLETRAEYVRTNSVGNLILGYQEDGNPVFARTGSHNLVVGPAHGHESFGGIVTGSRSRLEAPYAAVVGGENNRVSGRSGVAVGGMGNRVDGYEGVVAAGYQCGVSGLRGFLAGGRHSAAPGSHSAVLGGSHALASGWLATVVGGTLNEASGTQSVVSGGFRNLASGWRATVNGGEHNTASGDHSSVAFGRNRDVGRMNLSGNTEHDGVAGSIWQDF